MGTLRTTISHVVQASQQIDRALQLRHDPAYLALIDSVARANTWDRRIDQLVGEFQKVVAEYRRAYEDRHKILKGFQPFWRSLYRHTKPYVKNFEMHPTFELHMEKVWLDK